MSTTMLKGFAVAAALSISAMTLATPAEAGKKSRNLAIGAAIGLGAAAIIAGSNRRNNQYNYGNAPGPYYYAPPPVSYAPPPVAYAPPPVAYAPPPVYNRYAPPPWSPAWYDYCRSKYRSFDPRSGTFQPWHGPRQLCR